MLLILLVSAAALGDRPMRVAVLPFTIYSEEKLDFLKQNAQQQLNAQLEEVGLEPASVEEVDHAVAALPGERVGEEEARRVGRALGVDWVVLGSLTKIGRSVSMDVRLIDVSGEKKPIAVFAQGAGLENLPAIATELAGRAALRLGLKQIIDTVLISGNQRIEVDAIRAVLESKEGGIFSQAKVSADLKRIYAMNYFDDVKVDVEDAPKGKVIRFIVDEKPSIQQIEISGTRKVGEEDVRGVLGYRVYSILDTTKVHASVDRIMGLYSEKGYYNTQVTYNIETVAPKRVIIQYKIKEGGRLYIQEIKFVGNEHFPAKKLLKLMETSEKNLFFWITDAGILNRDTLTKDLNKVVAFYNNNGYIKAKVGDPDIRVEEDGIFITIAVSEGPQYKVGLVSFSGDLIEPTTKMAELVRINKESVFNREVVYKDLQAIDNLYTASGYAYADIQPIIQEHDETLSVDINFKITKNRLVYFERIDIAGNTKTREKVIRRQLKISEGDLFSAEKLRTSNMNLHRLGYFEDVEITPSKGSDDSKMNVHIEVKEQPTGAFSFGFGYSSYNQFYGVASVSQSNLFGRGQRLKLEASIGSRITNYSLAFTEPWLFDIPLLAGFSIFDQTQQYDTYDRETRGLSLVAGYPLMDYVTLTGRFRYDNSDISDVDDAASDRIKDMEGQWLTRSMSFILRRDTRNRYFNPTSGSDNSISVEYAGGIFGGDAAFTRYIMDSGWFFPLPWFEHVFFIRGKAGYIVSRTDDGLPIYERFYLGGMNSVRGFAYGDVSPKDPETGDVIGGIKMALFNVEYIFPLYKESGLVGVFFFDAGNAWEEDEPVKGLRQSVGAGIRFYSPLGPLRLEWGYILDPEPGEERSRWEFSIGTFF